LLGRSSDVTIQFNPERAYCMSEIIFEVNEDEVDGGYTAAALGYGIYTQGDTLDQLRTMVKDAVACYFDESNPGPKIIRLHFVRDEVLVQ
jgi:predicted RNase H-like HicB family nuclease